MATSPGNSASGAASRCTVRHLVDAVCKIRRQKQCATTARIHKAVRQQLQRNVEVEEVLEQLNVATGTGELWRVDNNGVTSYREPPKGTSKEHLKWSAEKHARWPSKDQQSGQFMLGHVKYLQNEHLNQPVNDHLAQRAHEHLPWTMAEQLRSSNAEPLRDHMMEPSRCSMNEPFMWPMTESVRWPAMNDPMSWTAAEPLRQGAVETVPQQRSETASWPINEPFRRPANDPLAWQMNQSLRGQMAEQFAWHVTEPLRHPMVDPLSWPVPEPLRRPMAEQLTWPGNDQLRRTIPEPLGWSVAAPESFRRPAAAEHFNWCSPDAVRQTAKDTYAKPVKDTSLLSRNSSDVSTVWPTRDATHAAHNSAKALSRSITNSQKDSYKETSASTFACPASQTMDAAGVLPQHKNRSISPSTGNANNKFQSLPIPGPCKELSNSCAELQRSCKQMPSVRKDVRVRDGMSQFGTTQNHYHSSTGEISMMPNGQGFCMPRDGQYSCLNNCSGNTNDSETRTLGSRRPLLLGSEIAPQIPTIIPVVNGQYGHVHDPPSMKKSGLSGKCEEVGKTFHLDKRDDSLDVLPSCSSTASHNKSNEVLQVAHSMFDDPKAEKLVAEQLTSALEADSSSAVCLSVQSAMGPSSFLSTVDDIGDASLSQCTSMMSNSPALQFFPNAENEHLSLCNTAGKAEPTEIKLPEEVDIGSCISGSFSDSAAKISEQCASIQSLTSSLDCIDDLCHSSVNDDQKPPSKDPISNKESVITDYNVPDHSEVGSQILKCLEVSKSKRKSRNAKKIHLNCNSFTQLTSAVQSAVKGMRVSGDFITTHKIKSVILSKFKVSSGSIWLLTRRILQFCMAFVRLKWLRKRRRLPKRKLLRFETSAKTDGCHTKQENESECGSKVCRGIQKLPDMDLLPVNDSCDRSVKENTSPKDLEPCSKTGENLDLDMCQSVDERSQCHHEPDSSSARLNDHPVDQEVKMVTDQRFNHACRDGNSLGIEQSDSAETFVGSSQDRLNEVDSVSREDCIPLINNQAEVNPNGLIDGLTHFFTPSNKRNSRVSRNTLQRTLEQINKNRTSPKKKTHLLSRVSQRRPQLRQAKTESFKAASGCSLGSSVLKLENKKPICRKAPSGRRREQLEDGLSHFFAVEGKRRSCTLGRSVGAESGTCSSKFNLPETEKSCAHSRHIRSRTRSLSLSEARDSKALSSKKQQKIDGEECDLSQMNVSRRGMLLCGKRRSRTLSASTHSSQPSSSTVVYVKSPLSSSRKLSENSGLFSAAGNKPSLGNLTESGRRTDGRSFDAVYSKSNFVPSGITKTTCRIPVQEKLLSCQSRSTSVQSTDRLYPLSFYSKSISSASCSSFANTGKSAMVKLTRLSSEDCSVLRCSGGSVPFETSDRRNDHVPVDAKSTTSEATNMNCDGDAAAALEDEDLATEQPTTIDMAEAHRVVQPSMMPNDMILFRKAQKIAAERILVTHELNNLDPCQPIPPRIQFGQYELITTYSSLYPPEFARLPKLFLCEFCLKYLKSQCALQLHMAKCWQMCPPGSELYRANDLSVFEVSGDVSPVYCQNICLLARSFVGSKSPVQLNMSPFVFYILTHNDDTGSHLVGYFAKEKYGSSSGVSIINLLVLPQHRKKGFGDFLIQFSYLICRLHKNPGSPLKPLSPESSKIFQSNWCKSITECLKTYLGPERQITIKDISLLTGIHSSDVSATLSSLQLIDGTKHDLCNVLSVSDEALDEIVSKWMLPYVDKRIRIDLKSLHWTKSSVQHILKTSLDSAKLSTAVRRKSARKIPQKRKEYEDDGISEIQAASKKYGNHCEFEGSLLRTTKRKMTLSLDVSPSKSVRLSSPKSVYVNQSSERLICDNTLETSEEESSLAWSVKPDVESMIKSADSEKPVMKPSKLSQGDGSECSSMSAADDQDPDCKIIGSANSLTERHKMKCSNVDGVTNCATILAQQEPTTAESKSVLEKKSVRSVEVQTDAYESEYSDDDSDASSSLSSGSCSHCNTSDESDVDEAEKNSQPSHRPVYKASVATENAEKDFVSKNDENLHENSASAKVIVSTLSSCTGTDSDATTAAAADDRTAEEESTLSTSCEMLNQGIINDLLTPESLDRVHEQLTPLSAKSGFCIQNNTVQLTETEEEGSQQLFDFQDSNKQSTYSKNAEFDADPSHKTIDEAIFQNNFSKVPTNSGQEIPSKSFVPQYRDGRHQFGQDLYSETTVASDNFQFSSTHPGSAPNLAIESPLSMNSGSDMGSCNVEQNPSQAYADCAQVHNEYNMENVGASPACGFMNNPTFNQIKSPGCNSRITSPVSNHSFNVTSCSPVIGNAAGYSSTSDAVTSQQLNQSSHHPATGTTFKMPIEDNRFASASSAYPINGFSALMTSPASLGQCSYMGQYAEQSPGGQCNVINQNSPNGLGYNMPTPSPTNSSSRSFNMASPNTNAVHGQPVGSLAYDRSCPSAPVLSYARVIPQQLTNATDNVPWTHIYPPQAAGYSLIKFPDQELVPQHAMALPRNLLPPQPTVTVQQHLTQVNLVPLSAKPAKCPTTPAPTTSKQHRRCGKSCKSGTSSGLSAVRSQTVAPNVTIQPGTNMITSYNVINMNVDYRAQHPPIAAYPSSPYISNTAFINDAQQMQSLNIYQHRAISFSRQPQPHNNVYTAAYGYINGAIAQQSFNINVNGIMRQ